MTTADNFLTTFILEKYGEIRRNTENLKHKKTLGNTGKISIFKGFAFGGEGEI